MIHLIINQACLAIPPKAKLITGGGDLHEQLLQAQGYEASDFPLASLLSTQQQLTGRWVIVSPAHWQASHNNACIEEYGHGLGLTKAQLDAAFKAYAAYLAEEGGILHYYNPWIWLLDAEKKPILHAKPPHEIIGKPLLPVLKEIDETHYWQRVLTNAQMFFTTQPCDSLLNGVWLWGDGHFTPSTTIRICATPEYLMLAKEASTKVDSYHPSIALSRYDVLLCDEFSALSTAHCEQLNESCVTWYWNNTTYFCAKEHALTRLWRRIKHAYQGTPPT